MISSYTKTLSHTTSTLDIEINVNLDEGPFNESFGLRDIFVVLDQVYLKINSFVK